MHIWLYNDIKDDMVGSCTEIKVMKYRGVLVFFIRWHNRLWSKFYIGLILLINRKDIRIHSFIHLVYKHLLNTSIMVFMDQQHQEWRRPEQVADTVFQK